MPGLYQKDIQKARLLALPLGRKLKVTRGQAPRALKQRGQHGVPGRASIAQR